MADNQSQKRCTMDSLKEKDNPAPNPAKRPRIEVDEELMRQMIAGQAPLDSEVVRRIPEPEEEDTNALEENTSETVSGASAPTAEKTGIDSTASTVKEHSGFRRKKLTLPDFEPKLHLCYPNQALRSGGNKPSEASPYRSPSTDAPLDSKVVRRMKIRTLPRETHRHQEKNKCRHPNDYKVSEILPDFHLLGRNGHLQAQVSEILHLLGNRQGLYCGLSWTFTAVLN